MKKHVLLAMAALALAVQVNARKKEIAVQPTQQAKAAFEKKFSGASKAKWEREGADLEVHFEQGGNKMSAVFDKEGTWKETETGISLKAFPVKALSFLKQNYPGQKIEEAAKIDKADGSVNYEAEVNKKDILFDSGGQFLK